MSITPTPRPVAPPLTKRQLSVWNANHYKSFGASANENWNAMHGWPILEARQALKKVHDSLYGICNPSGKVKMSDYVEYFNR